MRISKNIGLAVLVTALSAATIVGCAKEKPKEEPKVEAPAPKVRVTDYTVQKGDNIARIARALYPDNPKKYAVALNDLNYPDLDHLKGNEYGSIEILPVGYPLKLPEKYPIYEERRSGVVDKGTI